MLQYRQFLPTASPHLYTQHGNTTVQFLHTASPHLYTQHGNAAVQTSPHYHPWRRCSLYSLNHQLDNGGGSSHPCPPLDCLKRWQSNNTCHHPHRFNELATKSEKCHVPMVDIRLQKLLRVCCPGHAGVKENDRADRLAGKATLTNGLLLGRPEVLRNLRHYQQAQSQGHHNVDCLCRREVLKEEALDDLQWKDARGQLSIRQTLEPFQRQCWGNFWEMGWSTYGLFWAHRHHLELNWTELNCQKACWKETKQLGKIVYFDTEIFWWHGPLKDWGSSKQKYDLTVDFCWSSQPVPAWRCQPRGPRLGQSRTRGQRSEPG